LRRYALSTLVNTLLQTEKPIPLEFLVNGTFLRTSLDEYLISNGISAETALTVEYVRAIVPPLYLASFEHDAWVSSVDVLSSTSTAAKRRENAAISLSGSERIVSGSFDGLLRVWNLSSEVLATSAGSNNPPVRTAKFLSPSQIASAGDDCTVRIWNYAEEVNSRVGSLVSKLELLGHERYVNDVAVHQSSNRILSGSADCSVGLWSMKKSDAPAAPTSRPPSTASSNKRRKLSNANQVPQRGPLSMMKGHADCVSATMFAPSDPTVAYSTSWDHTLKTWDLPTASVVDTRTTSASLFSLASLSALNLVATGSSDKFIALIDPRASATTVTAMTLRGHTNSVVSLAPDPASSYALVSGSHDGTCRVWDVRSASSEREGRVGKSIYTITRESAKGEKRARAGGEGSKVFDVVWDADVGIVSASEDKRVQINQGKGVTSESNDTQDVKILQ
ncbi:MAG: hypothetical protein Q9191_003844, partial [Dirinaria sp. TL-2023a]